jgi:glutaredoxin 3
MPERMPGSRRSVLAGALLIVLLGVAMLPALVPAADDAPVAGAPRVEIYTTPSCPFCKALRAYLKARDIDYVEHNVNATLETRAAFYATGAQGVPVVVIGERTIHGFNPAAIESALKAARAGVPAEPGSATPAES